MKDNLTYEKEYRDYKINNGNRHDFGCYIKTLDQSIDQLEYCIGKHSKCLNVRLDIRNPVGTKRIIQRENMTRILENGKRNIERRYKDKPNKPDFKVVWTTENESNEKNPHYHLQINVNGNAVQNGYAIKEEVEKAVNTYFGNEYPGLVEFCKSNGKYGIMIDKNTDEFQENLEKAVYINSYLAKTRSKEVRPKGARISSASKLRK